MMECGGPLYDLTGNGSLDIVNGGDVVSLVFDNQHAPGGRLQGEGFAIRRGMGGGGVVV